MSYIEVYPSMIFTKKTQLKLCKGRPLVIISKERVSRLSACASYGVSMNCDFAHFFREDSQPHVVRQPQTMTCESRKTDCHFLKLRKKCIFSARKICSRLPRMLMHFNAWFLAPDRCRNNALPCKEMYQRPNNKCPLRRVSCLQFYDI